MSEEGVTTKAPRSFLDLIAECDGEQAAILLRWAEQASVDLNTLAAVFGDELKTSAAASVAMRSLRGICDQLRGAGNGLRSLAAVRARDLALAAPAGGAGFAPQGMLRPRAPKK